MDWSPTQFQGLAGVRDLQYRMDAPVLEEDCRLLLTQMIQGRELPISLDQDQQSLLALWATKTAMNPHNCPSLSHTRRTNERERRAKGVKT